MIREVDLVSYLPPFMQKYKEPVAALEAENPEFTIIWDATNRVLYNRFISTADEYGISRYENLLGIHPNSTDTLEMRRMRVQNRWLNTIPYTMKSLIAKFIELLGGERNFSIWSDFQNSYEMVLTVYSLDDSQVDEIKFVLSTMIPVNIVTGVIYEHVQVGNICFGAIMQEGDIIEIMQR